MRGARLGGLKLGAAPGGAWVRQRPPSEYTSTVAICVGTGDSTVPGCRPKAWDVRTSQMVRPSRTSIAVLPPVPWAGARKTGAARHIIHAVRSRGQ